MIHYELFFFYIAGFKPKDVIRQFGYSRGTAYRFYRIYREARKRAQSVIQPTQREKERANLGEAITKSNVLGDEKWKVIEDLTHQKSKKERKQEYQREWHRNHPRAKGYNNKDYHQRRNAILEDHNNQCDNCGCTDMRVLEIHHISKNIVTVLCANCHSIEHARA